MKNTKGHLVGNAEFQFALRVCEKCLPNRKNDFNIQYFAKRDKFLDANVNIFYCISRILEFKIMHYIILGLQELAMLTMAEYNRFCLVTNETTDLSFNKEDLLYQFPKSSEVVKLYYLGLNQLCNTIYDQTLN